MAAVARAARPVARAAAGRYGAALASRCARGVISRQDRGRYTTRADARENAACVARRVARARRRDSLAERYPGTRLSRPAAAATHARTTPGPARAAAAAGTPATPHTHPPTHRRARRSLYAKSEANRESVLDRFARDRVCAVLRTATAEACPKAMTAAIEGGFKIAEFTLTTPGCLDTLADFRAKYDGDVMVGCGTIMNTTDAEAACDAGAEFIITPVLVPEVVEWCVQRDIVIIPGCQTPTEAYNAYKLGAPLQKIFPGVAGAHAWVKAVSAALPMLRLNPTSGVDLDNAGDFLANGAASVGLVAPLFDPAAVQAGDWDQIRANAAKVIGNAAKAGPLKR